MSNLVKRTLSALFLGPLFILAVYYGNYGVFVVSDKVVTISILLTFSMFFIMFYEWVMLTGRLKQKLLWFIFGFFYLGIGCSVFFILNLSPFRGDFLGFSNVPVTLFVLILLIWINDIFSYIFGRSIGGPKLAPKISPNKTWAGAIGGVVGCVMLFFIMNYFVKFRASEVSDTVFLIALAVHILVPLTALVGDLFESYLKRKAGVKDSGSIIPGHGGLLDRMDGFILVMNIAGLSTYIWFSIQTAKMATGVAQ
jgi:phosphatidate cytidylyltransferase